MPLSQKSGFKANLVSFWRPNWEEKKGKREKKKKERRSSQASQRYGTLDFVWKLNLCMDSMRLSMNFHALMVILLPKSRVFARVSS